MTEIEKRAAVRMAAYSLAKALGMKKSKFLQEAEKQLHEAIAEAAMEAARKGIPPGPDPSDPPAVSISGPAQPDVCLCNNRPTCAAAGRCLNWPMAPDIYQPERPAEPGGKV